MDNFHFDMTSEGDDCLRQAFALAGQNNNAVGYRVSPDKGLILYWVETKRPGYMPLPYPMTLLQAADFTIGWLAHADHGKQPDHDGDNGKGWRIYSERWGNLDGEHQALLAVQPVWAIHGK